MALPMREGQIPSGDKALAQRLTSNLTIVGKSLGRGLAVLGAGAVLSTLAAATARWQASRADKKLPEEFLLEVDLTEVQLVESASTNPLEILQQGPVKQLELRKLVKALETASQDTRVKGLLTKLGKPERWSGVATVQEVRKALESFRTSVKARDGSVLSVAFSPTFGEAGTNGTLEYYLASACDKVQQAMASVQGVMEAWAGFDGVVSLYAADAQLLSESVVA